MEQWGSKHSSPNKVDSVGQRISTPNQSPQIIPKNSKRFVPVFPLNL